jgi:DNA-directed RNA polymerase subunit RPC12/RpoP
VYDFEFPSYKCDYSYTENQLQLLEIKPPPDIVQWGLESLEFKRPGYNSEGPFRLHKWQESPARAFMIYPRLLMVGTPQTGKSLIADLIMFYCMAILRINGMIAYSENKTVETVFKDRIRVMIESNDCLRKLWDGNEDNMTIDRVKLLNCAWRIASAFNKNTLATFAAGVTIGSEVGKWQKVKFDPVLTLEGRQGSYYSNGFLRTVLETSAFEVGDYMYKEVFTSGTLIVHPHYKCPHCGHWQEWTDSQIKVKDDKFRYEEIMQYKFDAVYYECVNCKKEITEQDRVRASEHVVWAAPEINQEDFSQKAEVINKDGSIDGVLENGKRPGVETICYRWPRLVDTGYKFWQCLAAFFKAKNDPVALKTYEAEIMSRYKESRSGRVEISHIESKKSGYLKNVVPDDVLVITAGFDTQDDGWWYAYVGWCFGLKWKILKHNHIPCSIDMSKDHVKLLSHFKTSLDSDKLIWANGIEADFRFAFMDRGGHRSEAVDYLCSRVPNLKAYIGLNKVDRVKPLIYESDKGDYHWGQTELLSEITGEIMESEDFFLPKDVSTEFIRQIMRQYRIKTVSPDGIVGSKWIHGGDDHCRDCLNMAYAAGKKIELDKILLDQTACETIYNSRMQINSNKIEDIATTNNGHETNNNYNRSGHYFNRAIGR